MQRRAWGAGRVQHCSAHRLLTSALSHYQAELGLRLLRRSYSLVQACTMPTYQAVVCTRSQLVIACSGSAQRHASAAVAYRLYDTVWPPDQRWSLVGGQPGVGPCGAGCAGPSGHLQGVSFPSGLLRQDCASPIALGLYAYKGSALAI